MGECVLVTGGAGFIGNQLVRTLLSEADLSLVVLDKLTYASRFDRLSGLLVRPRIAFIEGDVGDISLAERLFQDFPISAVIHLAAESHVDRSIAEPQPFLESNVVGTFRLAEVARAAWRARPTIVSPRWIQVSTDEVYGDWAQGEADTRAAFRPNSPYSASKAAADLLLQSLRRTYGFPLIETRSCNNYGPHQHDEKFIPRMIRAAIAGEPLPIYGDGLQEREWMHVSDHTAGLLTVLRRGQVGACYHLGSGDRRTNRAVAEQIIQRVSEKLVERGRARMESRWMSVADRPGHDRRYALASESTYRELNWRPDVEFDAGLDETIEGYLE